MNLRLVIIPTVLALLFGGGYLVDRNRQSRESVLSGYFENQPTQVASRLGGRVTTILVKEGDHVSAGQPLIKFEDVAYSATVKAQEAALEQARQQRLETQRGSRSEDIRRQQAAVQETEADYRKLVNGPLPEEIAAARDKYREARQNYLKLSDGSRPEDIAAARAAEALAKSKLDEANNGLTGEERNELKARLDEAISEENLDQKKLGRLQTLFDQDAISAQDLDVAKSAYEQARGRREDAEQALKRAQQGTRPEEVAQAQASYRQAHAQLQLLVNGSRKEDIEAARQEMLSADENYRLLQRGSRSEDIAAAKQRLSQAQASLDELTNGNRPEDVAKARAAQAQASQQLENLKSTYQEKKVFAPIAANVDRVLVADGDLLSPNSPVIQLSDPTDIWIRVYLPENELAKVKVGDSATLSVDGISGDLPGKVESIATQGEFTPANLQSPEDRGRQVFGIRIRLASPDLRVKAGMAATVRRVGSWP